MFIPILLQKESHEIRENFKCLVFGFSLLKTIDRLKTVFSSNLCHVNWHGNLNNLHTILDVNVAPFACQNMQWVLIYGSRSMLEIYAKQLPFLVF